MPDLFGFTEMEANIKNRFIYSCFCLLIFVILAYFWNSVRGKEEARQQSRDGLGYLSLTYLLYFVLGMASVYKAPLSTKYILSGLVSVSFLLSLPLFSLGNGPLDRIAEHTNWQRGAKLFGFAWIVMLSWVGKPEALETIDYLLSVVAFLLLAYFISRYFFHRQMLPLALLAVLAFSVIILLELFQPEALVPYGKFGASRTLEDVNSVVLGPALLLSVMFLSYTFSWINELSFKELSRLWTNNDQDNSPDLDFIASASTNERNEFWNTKLAQDHLEEVIESIILSRKHRNEDLEPILILAARNTRNNNDRLQELITDADYRAQRNKVTKGLIGLISGQF